tara:strand:- start:29766 stop:32117 length:2352 start_codon:yes stop_codon:yes gene_type:complete
MKNKSTLAKLLSNEDINVVHKQMETAYFDSKKRELGLPIWKDEDMTPTIYDLMISHEIGHALWTPLDMLEKAALRKINHSFVNIIEDARIERFVKEKYAGTIGVFNRGYVELVAKDFFGTKGKDVNSFNLIDKINLFFKGNTDVTFSDEEKVWVDRTAKTKTPDDVLDLAEELYKWMEENESETDNHDNGEKGEGEESSEGNDSSDGSGEKSGEDSKSTSGNGSSKESSDEEKGSASGNEKGEKEDDGNSDNNASGSKSDSGDDKSAGSDDTSDKSEVEEDTADSGDGETKNSGTEGGVDSDGKGGVPVATTDSAFGKAMDALRDKLATDRVYGKIPKIDIDKYVVGYKTVIDEFYNDFVSKTESENNTLFFDSSLKDVETLKEESKKTVAYMVKEFEMKKAADQYARAAESKTGSLDMSKLHTYKYNEDLFLKVTTLPGATNHGMMMVLDWSGSMHDNLKGTLAQLFNLVWFCRKVKIPFEVFAFSDAYGRKSRNEDILDNFKYGEIALHNFKLLNFFSSNMTLAEEVKMMHSLMMFSNRYGGYRDWATLGYPLTPNDNYNMGGTPLNDAIIAMMDIVPKFKEETGVQKVHTIFLTDGASNSLHGVYDYHLVTEDNENYKKGDHIKTIHSVRYSQSKFVITDPVVNKTFMIDRNTTTTNKLLEILKNRVDGMNVIGFFIAGSGKSGRVDKRTIQYLIDEYDMSKVMELVKFVNKNKYLALTQCGYDEYYVLPGGNALAVENEGLGDELVGASKAKLKTAFGKSMKGKIESRQLLNKFVKLVA